MALSPEERTLYRALAALIAFVFAGGVLGVANRAEDDRLATTAGRDEPFVSARLDAAPGAVGPLPGVDVATYLRSRAEALAASRGRRAAVVSFVDYLTDAAARQAAGELRVRRLLVAAPGGEARVVDDVVTWVEDEQRVAREEKTALQELLPTVGDPEFVRQYREDIARLDRIARGVDAETPLVFGVVVVADADQLRTLARRRGIRLVDVARGADMPGEVRGLRPEELVRAGEPPTRP